VENSEPQTLEIKRLTTKIEYDRKSELGSIQTQLRYFCDIFELQKSIIGELMFRLWVRDLKVVKQKLEQIDNCIDTVICLIGDVIVEIDKQLGE